MKVISKHLNGTLIKNLIAICTAAAGFFLLVSCLLVVIDVVFRFLISKSPVQASVVSEALMVVIVFLGLSYAQKAKRHIKAEVLSIRLSSSVNSMINLFSYLLAIVIFILLGYQGVIMTYNSWLANEVHWVVKWLPIWPSKAAIPFGSFVFCLQLFKDAFEEINILQKKYFIKENIE